MKKRADAKTFAGPNRMLPIPMTKNAKILIANFQFTG